MMIDQGALTERDGYHTVGDSNTMCVRYITTGAEAMRLSQGGLETLSQQHGQVLGCWFKPRCQPRSLVGSPIQATRVRIPQ